MKVYTLTGKSGTGKSYQAINLCKEKNIESIIDDGLFIYKNRVEAGISAKRQKTMAGAIKTALFTLDEHASSVAARIQDCLLYTSVEAIAEGDGTYVIDADKCIDCGACAGACPVDAPVEA